MECYLDNSATTRCLDSAAALMAGILCRKKEEEVLFIRKSMNQIIIKCSLSR